MTMLNFWVGFAMGLMVIPYVLFLRGLWRGAIGYPAENIIERWMK